jgi:hypothetical protein
MADGLDADVQTFQGHPLLPFSMEAIEPTLPLGDLFVQHLAPRGELRQLDGALLVGDQQPLALRLGVGRLVLDPTGVLVDQLVIAEDRRS